MNIHYIAVPLGGATPDNPEGFCVEGWYTLDGSILRMVYQNGKPVRRLDGTAVEHVLLEGEEPRKVAARLTKEIRLNHRGDRLEGFGRSGPLTVDGIKGTPV